MDPATLHAQIKKYEQCICELEEENRALRERVVSLDKAVSENQRRKTQFDEYIWNEKSKLQRAKDTSQIRIAVGFAEAMSSYYGGQHQADAEYAFSEITSKLKSSRRDAEDDILGNNRSIDNLRDEIAYLKTRLAGLS